MLAAAPLRHINDELHGEMVGFSIGVDEEFPQFSDGNLLDVIVFDDLFVDNGEELLDLEMEIEMDDLELLAEFSISKGGGDEESNKNTFEMFEETIRKEDENKLSRIGSVSSLSQFEEIESKMNASMLVNKGHEEGKKLWSQRKNCHGKKKVKVDWTPELHRRFVQAVEQLGVDKAVPSKILELMGIDCLTRHNIASHLQKYRSHRKHVLAREAEAASWSQRRQTYGPIVSTGICRKKPEINPLLLPTMGFPPHITPPPPPPPVNNFRQLHVWGHPSRVYQSLSHTWPKHLVHWPSLPPPPMWTRPPHQSLPSLLDSSYWHPHLQHIPNVIIPPGAQCYPSSLITRSAPPHVRGIPPHPMYNVHSRVVLPTEKSNKHPPFDLHLSKERIDAVIEDVISKPWLPLPLGLKPPSMDSVMMELQRQGVPEILPSVCS